MKSTTVTTTCRWCNQDVPKKTFLRHVKLKCRYSPTLSTGEKICIKCQKILQRSEFYGCASKPDKLTTECKECTRENLNRYRETNCQSADKSRVARTRPGGWVLKPCPHCGKEFGYNALVTHKPRCQHKPTQKRGRPPIPNIIVPEHTAEARDIAKTFDGARDSYFRFNYGITLSEYETIFTAQGGVCAICKQPWRGGRGKKIGSLSVDHNHSTGKVRGLLCHMCNIGIGHFNEDVGLLETAIAYIERTRATVAE